MHGKVKCEQVYSTWLSFRSVDKEVMSVAYLVRECEAVRAVFVLHDAVVCCILIVFI